MVTHEDSENSQMDVAREAIAAELRAEQGRSNLTDKALSDATGITPRTIGRYLNAKTPIPVNAYMEIARALNVDGGDLLDRVYDKLRQQG